MNWLNHFRTRPAVQLDLFQEERLTESEHHRVSYSIAQFQRGESSEAQDFLSKSKLFALELGDFAFFEESQLFVQEENYHSYLLGVFMEQAQIDFATESWADTIFRWVRSLGDIAWSSRVLLMAELLAQVYYPALKEATSSPLLQAICDRIIADEAYHITFQTERIARVLKRRSLWHRWVHTILGAILFWGMAVGVWLEHGKVFSCTLSFWQFLRASSRCYQVAMSQLNSWLIGNSWKERRLSI